MSSTAFSMNRFVVGLVNIDVAGSKETIGLGRVSSPREENGKSLQLSPCEKMADFFRCTHTN